MLSFEISKTNTFNTIGVCSIWHPGHTINVQHLQIFETYDKFCRTLIFWVTWLHGHKATQLLYGVIILPTARTYAKRPEFGRISKRFKRNERQ